MTPQEFIQYETDVRESQIAFPEMEMGEGYDKFMREIKKQEPMPRLSTGDKSLEMVKSMIRQAFRRPCTQCPGEQILEGICEGCEEGKQGYKSKWTCTADANHRELSKKIYLDWYNELTVVKEGEL